jgi:hypothetical protein
MDLNTFLPIAKKFGLVKHKNSFGNYEFCVDTNKFYCTGNCHVCTFYYKENKMGGPNMKVQDWNGGFDLAWGSDVNLRNDVIFDKPKFVERALTEMFKRLEKFKRK